MNAPIRLLVVSLPLAACTLQPASGVPRTGEPLSIHTYQKTQTQTRDEKVADYKVKDSYGNTVSTGSVYEERQYQVTTDHWRPRQGSRFISDEDLFRITGDEQAAEEARQYRRRGKALAWGGGASFAASLVLLGVAGSLQARGQSKASVALGGVGLLVGTAAALPLGFGLRRLTVDGHPHGIDRAYEAVDRYNRELPEVSKTDAPAGRTWTLGWSGRF